MSENAKVRHNPQTKTANSFGYPSQRGSGAGVVTKSPASHSNGKRKG